MTIQRLLVVGSNGLLGQKVVELFVRGSSAEITASSVEPAPVRNLHSVAYRQTDITSKKDVRALVSAVEPGVIINCAAMTGVDACETERELAWKINVSGVEHLADAAKRANAALVHISTDYVFDGKHGPYSEDDRPEPLSYYGKTKLASENALRASDITYLILRTMVLYGHAEGVKANFALWLIESLQKKSPVKVVEVRFRGPAGGRVRPGRRAHHPHQDRGPEAAGSAAPAIGPGDAQGGNRNRIPSLHGGGGAGDRQEPAVPKHAPPGGRQGSGQRAVAAAAERRTSRQAPIMNIRHTHA